MDRRSAIRCSAFISAGLVLMPACSRREPKSFVALNNLPVTTDQEEMLGDLCEFIIPKSTTPGARDLSSQQFVLTMVDDCFNPPAQQKFISGILQFESLANKSFGRSFTQCTAAQKTELLRKLENKNGVNEDALFFYSSTKRLTVQSFTSSQYYLTRVHIYEMAPARYHGCVPVATSV